MAIALNSNINIINTPKWKKTNIKIIAIPFIFFAAILKFRTILLRGNFVTRSLAFNPGVEIVHVIAKNFYPVNRAEFNPGVENAPCNRPLSRNKPVKPQRVMLHIASCSKSVLKRTWRPLACLHLYSKLNHGH